MTPPDVVPSLAELMTPTAGRSSVIPVAGPWITELEVALVTQAARDGWYDQANHYCERFEAAFARYVGRRYALALPSCTSALHLAMAALGVGPGDEVIVPDITWIASAAPVTYLGARPVFADIDAETWCLSAATVERCLSPRTKAIVVVDLYGGTPADIDDLRALAAARGLPLIEDAAQAIGSENRGRKAGALGDVGVFSFHGTKTMTTGEGGMLVTDREEVWSRARKLSNHGRADDPRLFWNDEVAFKYKMSAMQAALGLGQLQRIDELVCRKREIFSWYSAGFADCSDVITLNHEPAATKNSYWMTTALIGPGRRPLEETVEGSRGDFIKESMIAALAGRGIASRPFFYPLSQLPAYSGSPEAEGARRRNGVAASLSARGINLPSALTLTRRDVATVVAAVRALLGLPQCPEPPGAFGERGLALV